MKHRSIHVVISLIIALVPVGSGLPIQAAQADTTSIVFASDQTDGIFQIYVMDADGSNQRQLTQGDGPNTEPVWSPDRQQIAFTSERDENSEIYVMDADGSNQHRLTQNHGTNITPTWSPDGQQIAFVSDQGGKNDLYILQVRDSSQRQLTTDPNPDVEVQTPAWSPDGQQIAYSSNADGHFQIYLLSVSGGSLRRLTQLDADCDSPAWAPDGSSIAFTGFQNKDGSLMTISASGGSPNLLTSFQDHFVGTPTWSPDGLSIAFMMWQITGPKSRAVAVIQANGQGWKQISDASNHNGWPSWSAPKAIARVDSSGSTSNTTDNPTGTTIDVGSGGIPPANQRNAAPAGNYRLTGGVGLTNPNTRLGPGEFQVEGYCHNLGYPGVRTDYRDWFCYNQQKTIRLTVADFDKICRQTYNNPNAFAVRDGTRDILAYDWRCYGPGNSSSTNTEQGSNGTGEAPGIAPNGKPFDRNVPFQPGIPSLAQARQNIPGGVDVVVYCAAMGLPEPRSAADNTSNAAYSWKCGSVSLGDFNTVCYNVWGNNYHAINTLGSDRISGWRCVQDDNQPQSSSNSQSNNNGATDTNALGQPLQRNSDDDLVYPVAYGTRTPPTSGSYIQVPAQNDGLFLRTTQDTSNHSNVIGTLHATDYYVMLQVTNNWVQIETSIATGWVSARYVDIYR